MKYIKVTIKTDDNGTTQRRWCKLNLGPGKYEGKMWNWYSRFAPSPKFTDLLYATCPYPVYNFYFLSPIDATMFSLRWSK